VDERVELAYQLATRLPELHFQPHSNAHNAASAAFMMSLEQNKLPNLVSEQSCT
jgi:hypothetical protein